MSRITAQQCRDDYRDAARQRDQRAVADATRAAARNAAQTSSTAVNGGRP